MEVETIVDGQAVVEQAILKLERALEWEIDELSFRLEEMKKRVAELLDELQTNAGRAVEEEFEQRGYNGS